MEETNMIESETTDMVTTEPTIKASSVSLSSEDEELQRLEHAPPFWRPNNHRKRLSKQLSMCETPRDIAWERRRRQIIRQERMKKHHQAEMSMMIDSGDQDILTDDDLNELKGCIELGFGFNELDQDGKRQLCHTLPALDLYFAVNRQVSPVSTPTPTNSSNRLSLGGDQSSSRSLGSRSSSFDSPGSDFDNSSWKICSPGDNPQQVKTKLRHWAQAVACSVMQSS
ncbi:uncharacterized protein LOC131316423 [Rhododendron vialii]|uniref:uncharacterized protein LOC131316423 n=1 Tax=Rhododendron vialii TaxID=182163 RepID=UPI00265E15C7|nr:uncharacterized protein LOC131316423 [Rhododendron vialii]